MASGALQAAGWAPMAPALWLAGLAGGPRAALRRALPALAGVARGLGQLLWQCKIPLYYLEAPPKPEPP